MVMDQMLPSADLLIVTNELEMDSLAKRAGGKRVNMIPVGNVLASRQELENVWLKHEGRPAVVPGPPAGPEGRKPYSLFHYGLPANGKGLDRLLSALQLVHEAGIAATLDLAGEFAPGAPLTTELLGLITEHGLYDSVNRLGHLGRAQIALAAEQCCIGVFPYDEGYSSKRSSIAGLCHLDLPLVVGAGSVEEHPFWAPQENTAASLAVLLVDCFPAGWRRWSGRLSGSGNAVPFSLPGSRPAPDHVKLLNADA
jgi:glycosyltransferase involved in cell wall biosynthesis